MMAYSKGAKRRARRARAAEGHTDMPGLAETPKRKRDGRFAESTRRPAEDARVVAFNARIRHFGPSVDAASVMLADPAGQAIHIGARDADEAGKLWDVFARYDAADERYSRRILGQPRFANVGRLDILPERFETRADDRPDLRSEDERDRDAVNGWMRWQGAMQSLGAHDAGLITRASRQTCGALVIGGRLSTTGAAFVAAMRMLRQVVERG